MNPTLQIVGMSGAMREIELEIACASRSDAKVLITGESGVGKEVVARLIHQRGQRARSPLVTINCAGIPESLLESELFGHVRGSFTDAYRDKRGWLEQADGGTIFMDEIGEMSLRMQALLLRFLENGELQRVGSDRISSVMDVRVIAATNRNLLSRIEDSSFRQDLYYRLNVIHIPIPPLRERRDDIRPLLEHFLRFFSNQHGIDEPVVSEQAMSQLVAHNWPGNVRELKNIVERLIVRKRSGPITPAHLPPEISCVCLEPPAPQPVTTNLNADALCERMSAGGESFWTVVFQPFMAHDLTRDDLREVVTRGLEQTRGNYKALVQTFNMDPDDYKRFLSFLRKHQCHMPFQRFRSARVRLADESGHEERLVAEG